MITEYLWQCLAVKVILRARLPIQLDQSFWPAKYLTVISPEYPCSERGGVGALGV